MMREDSVEYVELVFQDGQPETDVVWMLECNVDDCGGEAMGLVMELLFGQGAKDVWFSPVFMKKNRPAYTLHVICDENVREELEDVIFSGTTTIGIRRIRMERTVLKRSFVEVKTGLGSGMVKLCRHRDRIYAYPEFESVKQICRYTGLDYQTVYHALKEEAVRQAESGGKPSEKKAETGRVKKTGQEENRAGRGAEETDRRKKPSEKKAETGRVKSDRGPEKG